MVIDVYIKILLTLNLGVSYRDRIRIMFVGKYNHKSLSDFLNKYISTVEKPEETKKTEKKSTTASSPKPEPCNVSFVSY